MDLGLERAGWEIAWQAETDPYCSAVLASHWPDVPNLGDITTIDWAEVPPVDLLTAGYPCQPFSQAGLRLGADDERHLWPDVARAIGVLRPRFVLLENVANHLVLGFADVLADLASLGFDAEWSVVSAATLGAPHQRERLYVLAYPTSTDGESDVPRDSGPGAGRLEPGGSRSTPRSDWWLSEPTVDRVAHGVPRSVVHPQLHALGNAQVPQVAEALGRMILERAA